MTPFFHTLRATQERLALLRIEVGLGTTTMECACRGVPRNDDVTRMRADLSLHERPELGVRFTLRRRLDLQYFASRCYGRAWCESSRNDPAVPATKAQIVKASVAPGIREVVGHVGLVPSLSGDVRAVARKRHPSGAVRSTVFYTAATCPSPARLSEDAAACCRSITMRSVGDHVGRAGRSGCEARRAPAGPRCPASSRSPLVGAGRPLFFAA